MQRLPSEVHGVLDYIVGTGLIVLPRVLGLKGRVAGLLTAAGLGTIAYSLLTDYELGIFKVLPFKSHLGVDAISAAAFIAAPILLKEEERGVIALLAGIGAMELAVTALTEPEAYQDDWANDVREQVADRLHR